MVSGLCLDAAEQPIMNSTLPVVWAGSCSVNVYLAGTLTAAASSRLIPLPGYALVQDRFYHHVIPRSFLRWAVFDFYHSEFRVVNLLRV